MAESRGARFDALIAFYRSKFRELEFFQFARLMAWELRRQAKERGATPEQLADWEALFQDNLRVRPLLSMGFPDTDLASVEVLRDGKVRVETTFFGLYGVTSPLPNFYTEDLIDASHEGLKVARGFIDIFHHAAFPLLIRAWSRYRSWTGLQDGFDSRQTDRRSSWVGLTSPAVRKRFDQWHAIVQLAPVLATQHRSATGLQYVFAAIAQSGQVQVRPCAVSRGTIPHAYRFCLGLRNNKLGEQAVLGNKVTDYRNFVDVHLSEQTPADLDAILPGGRNHALLRQSIDLFLKDSLSLRIKVKTIAQPKGLGNSRLGLGSILGQEPAAGKYAFVMNP